MHSASAPAASSRRAASSTSAGSTTVWMLPSASVRSATSRRRSRSMTGIKLPVSPQVWRRSRRRISSTSRKPAVVISPARAPRRSSSALVPTVVPCTMADTCGRGVIAAMPSAKPTASWPRVLHLANARGAARFVEQEQVCVGAPDIDPDDDPAARCNTAAHSTYPSRRSRAAAAGSRCAGSPRPPPPGVSSRMRWPRESRMPTSLDPSGGVCQPSAC